MKIAFYVLLLRLSCLKLTALAYHANVLSAGSCCACGMPATIWLCMLTCSLTMPRHCHVTARNARYIGTRKCTSLSFSNVLCSSEHTHPHPCYRASSDP